MTKFRSRHYPSSNRKFLVVQELALRYYGIIAVFIMIGVLTMLQSRQDGSLLFWFVIGGMFFAVIMGNLLALVKLRKSWAELFFVGSSFTLLSTYDILYGAEPLSFPVAYANASRSPQNQDIISIHYTDTIIVLKREDWEDFDLIWSWLNPAPQFGQKSF